MTWDKDRFEGGQRAIEKSAPDPRKKLAAQAVQERRVDAARARLRKAQQQ